MLLHQADKLLIGPLTTPIMDTFGINEAQMGSVSSWAVLVSAVFYPVWGYLFDRYSRSRLLALASAIWGGTTWLNAIAPTFGTFRLTRATTGIDDSAYPGLYSLLSDYFGPRIRGRVYGLIDLAQPLGFLLGTLLATFVGAALGWRNVFFITGTAGIFVAVLIFFGVREPRRGQAEPEMAGVLTASDASEGAGGGPADAAPRINKEVALGLLKKPSYLLLAAQGFFGVFPWQVLTFWFFRYLEKERGYSGNEAMMTMIVAILTLSAGYLVGGSLGDFFFRRNPRGRVLVSMVGVLLGSAFLVVALRVPAEDKGLFLVPLALTGLTMSIASPNVKATIHDVTEPEVRGTAQAMLQFSENIGSAVAPWLAGVIAVASSLHVAILVICVSTWLACAVLFAGTALTIPRDVARLRETMRARAEEAAR